MPGAEYAPGFSLMADMPPEVALAVFKHCSWVERGRLLCLCRYWGVELAQDPRTWAFLCEMLAEEEHVYLPGLPASDPGQRARFLAAFPLRMFWRGEAGLGSGIPALLTETAAGHGFTSGTGETVQSDRRV